MTNVQASPPQRRLNTRVLLTGATLIAAGVMISLVGAALSGSALLAGTRHRMRQMDVPPHELAKRKLLKAKAATTAGAEAWQKGSTQVGKRQSP